MIKNYLKIALRNLWRYKGFSLLNIISLTLGIAFTLLIGLWVNDEWQMNRFHKDLDNLYLVRTNMNWGSLFTGSNTPGPFRDALKSEIANVKAVTRVTGEGEALLSLGAKNLKSFGFYADNDFFEMFSFPTIQGDTKRLLADPQSIVITQSLAEKLFGNADPMGQTVQMDKTITYKVSGVVEDPPLQSDIQFTWVAPWLSFAQGKDWVRTWGNVAFSTYVQLADGTDYNAINKKIAYIGQAKDFNLEFFLQPFKEVYLYGNFNAGKQDGGRIEYLKLFSTIAVFLLIIACINFMNLATARSSRRAKEIGIRKTVGATQQILIGQFVGEALLLATISFVIALGITNIGLDTFNNLLTKSIQLDWSSPILWGGGFALILVTGLLAGSYPAFLLSALKPVRVLKGEILKVGDRGSFLRKGLVIFQFVISAILIIATLTIHSQINYIKNKNLGYDRNDLFYFNAEGPLEEKAAILRESLEKSTAVKYVTFTGGNPMNLSGTSNDLTWPGKAEDEGVPVAAMGVGDEFIEAMGLELVAGRAFSKDHPMDTSNYILNEAAVEAIGLEDPIGTTIDFWNGEGQIVGVVKNYHLQSLHVPIRPMILVYSPVNWKVWIKPEVGKIPEALAHVEQTLSTLNPGYPFEYEFADRTFEKQYQNEVLTGKLANIFGAIAIIISCLGLMGLAAYSAERRRREIGIRKVLGASVNQIIQLLSKDFVILTLIALGIALPLGAYFMQMWLDQFTYRIPLQWSIFVWTAMIAIGVAILTVGVQSLRAAISNPVDSIRQE